MKSGKLRIAVIFGGRSGEHEVSLMSARSVLAALNRNKYQIIQIGISREGHWFTGDNVLSAFNKKDMKSLQPVAVFPDEEKKGLYVLSGSHGRVWLEKISDIDVFFPVIHGSFGEDGTLQGLLEFTGIPYVGAGVIGSAVGMDKGIFKDVMRANHIPVVEGMTFRKKAIEENIEEVIEQSELISDYPLFVKPANMGSSVGVSKCSNRLELYDGLKDASLYDRRVLVERGINAREIEISVLGNRTPEVSIPGEIVPAAEFYSYEAKYHDDQSKLLIPAPISESLTKELQRTASLAYQAIDCLGMARVDFLLDRETGAFYLNEVNTIPGFTQISMYPKLWEASGLPYEQLLDRLIDLAIEIKQEKETLLRVYKEQE